MKHCIFIETNEKLTLDEVIQLASVKLETELKQEIADEYKYPPHFDDIELTEDMRIHKMHEKSLTYQPHTEFASYSFWDFNLENNIVVPILNQNNIEQETFELTFDFTYPEDSNIPREKLKTKISNYKYVIETKKINSNEKEFEIRESKQGDLPKIKYKLSLSPNYMKNGLWAESNIYYDTPEEAEENASYIINNSLDINDPQYGLKKKLKTVFVHAKIMKEEESYNYAISKVLASGNSTYKIKRLKNVENIQIIGYRVYI